MAIRKKVVCESCEAEFDVKHNMDEDYYEIEYCPFCGAKVLSATPTSAADAPRLDDSSGTHGAATPWPSIIVSVDPQTATTRPSRQGNSSSRGGGGGGANQAVAKGESLLSASVALQGGTFVTSVDGRFARTLSLTSVKGWRARPSAARHSRKL